MPTGGAMAVLTPTPANFGFEAVIELSSGTDERFVLLGCYETKLPVGDGAPSVDVELLVDPRAETFWASIAEVGVAASGDTPAEAAAAAIRAATSLL